MKVLYVTHVERNENRGAAYADLQILQGLRHLGHQVDEVWDIGSPRMIRHDNLHLLLEAPRKCEQCVRRSLSGHDLVFVNQPLGWRAARWLKLTSGPQYVARTHGWEPNVWNELYPFNKKKPGARALASAIIRTLLFRQNHLIGRWADAVVCGSAADRRYIKNWEAIPQDRIEQVSPGVPCEFLVTPTAATVERRRRSLLYTGQFAPFKAPEVVAGVMTGVLSSMPDAVAAWVCDAKDHARVRALFPSNAMGQLSLFGWQTRETLRGIYDDHGIYLFPSYYEGFGQTFLEAMARGLVVLASRVGGMAEVIRDGENGFLFAPGDVAGMTERALWLMQDPGLAARIGENARSTAARYTWSNASRRVETFFDRIIEEGRVRW